MGSRITAVFISTGAGLVWLGVVAAPQAFAQDPGNAGGGRWQTFMVEGETHSVFPGDPEFSCPPPDNRQSTFHVYTPQGRLKGTVTACHEVRFLVPFWLPSLEPYHPGECPGEGQLVSARSVENGTMAFELGDDSFTIPYTSVNTLALDAEADPDELFVLNTTDPANGFVETLSGSGQGEEGELRFGMVFEGFANELLTGVVAVRRPDDPPASAR